MVEQPAANLPNRVRIGAVAYLNAQPLTFFLDRFAADAEITVDLPSRLADGLTAGRFDVALIPSVEYFRQPGCSIVSDACVACDGPVHSVKLYGRVRPEKIRTLALDEGSRTSAAMTRILLKERFDLEPELVQLPIGIPVEETSADAAMLIGDRGMRAPPGRFEFVWDMGQEWSEWTGLPFVFAMWIARPGFDSSGMAGVLAAARDEGVGRLDEIAQRQAPLVGVAEAECLAYLRDRLRFRLGDREQQGLRRFRELAGRHGLAPAGGDLVFHDQQAAR